MRSAQILALAGLAAAQSTTVVIENGITTTIVLPVWDTAAPSVGVGEATVTFAVPTGSIDTPVVSVAIPDVTATLLTSVSVAVPTEVTATVSVPTPSTVVVNGAHSVSAKSLAGLAAAAVAAFALL
jgi:hypothetical protein